MAPLSREEFYALHPELRPKWTDQAGNPVPKEPQGRQIGMRRNWSTDSAVPMRPAGPVPIPSNPADHNQYIAAVTANDLQRQVNADLGHASEHELAQDVAAASAAASGQVALPAEARFTGEWTAPQGDPGARPVMAYRIAEKVGTRPGESQVAGPLIRERERRNVLSELQSMDFDTPEFHADTGAPIVQAGHEALARSTGRSVFSFGRDIARRSGEFMETLGLNADQALGLAEFEAKVSASDLKDKEKTAAIDDFMRQQGLYQAIETNTELRPFRTGDGSEQFDPNDPAIAAVRKPLTLLSREETQNAAYGQGNVRRIGGSRRLSSFNREPGAAPPAEGGIPFLTADATEVATEKVPGTKNDRRPVVEVVTLPDGSTTEMVVKQAPRTLVPTLDKGYAQAVRNLRSFIYYGNPADPQVQGAILQLEELKKNPVFATYPSGGAQYHQALGPRQAAVQVLNPTAVAQTITDVHRIPRPTTESVGSFDIANTVLPDVGQEEHGFRDIDDPFSAKGYVEEPYTIGRKIDELAYENMSPLRTFALPVEDPRELPEWPGATHQSQVRPKGAFPMVVRHGGNFYSVAEEPLGTVAYEGGPNLYRYSLNKVVYPQQDEPQQNADGMWTRNFRLAEFNSKGEPFEPSILSTKGFRAIGNFVNAELAARGITGRDGSEIQMLANQAQGDPEIAGWASRVLLDQSGATPPQERRYYQGSWPNERVATSSQSFPSPFAPQMYSIIKAVRDQGRMAPNYSLPTFEAPGSPEVVHYQDAIRPELVRIANERQDQRRKANLLDKNDKSSEIAQFNSAFVPPTAQQQVVADNGVAWSPSLLKQLPGHAQQQIGSMMNPDGSLNKFGEHWFKVNAPLYFTAPAAPAPLDPGGKNDWHDNLPRIPAATPPASDSMGDHSYLYEPAPAGSRSGPQRATRVTPIADVPENFTPEVRYSPTLSALRQMAVDRATGRLPGAAPRATAPAAPTGERMIAYVEPLDVETQLNPEARPALAAQAVEQEPTLIRYVAEAKKRLADRRGGF